MATRIEQVYCALGDADANGFIKSHPDWELHSVVGIPADAETFGAPGYIFIKRENVEVSFSTH